ncbi:hypothetical protein L596_016968 [Steinernema carpocapsae]|uniref:Uncharacterized protein n=1 Tax=Steinernema carpocapsae TaxID=34508 RepID=A0A4V6A1K3_STECR|nr:hypothetical protein L596_016968 [Steinernema carpocapsae]
MNKRGFFRKESKEEENSLDHLPYYHREFLCWKHPLFKSFATFILVDEAPPKLPGHPTLQGKDQGAPTVGHQG